MSTTTIAARRDLKVIGLVGTGHFFSHFYILTLPPLFPLLRGELGVSYTALGVAIAVLNVTTALTQAPCGFLVDRFGARWILVAGLALFAVAVALVGVFATYWALVALMVLAGLGNSVFHPADYTILAHSVRPERMGRAFSIHIFGGYFGFAVAPVVIVFLTELLGWRAALVTGGGLGLAWAALMAVNAAALGDDGAHDRAAGRPRSTGTDIRLLLSPPILLALAFFVMLALAHGGATGFTVAALATIYAAPLVEANAPLTVYLFAGAAGVLAGGWMADRIARQDRAIGVYVVVIGISVALVAVVTPPLAAVAVLLGIAGFFSGAIAPSRDMMVRAVTPPGATGKVFGFVTTGFNIGGVIAPPLFGLVLDFGDPRLVFWLVAAISFATLLIVFAAARQARSRPLEAGAAD